MTQLWPEAPIFTLLYDEDGLGPDLRGRSISTSYLQRLPVPTAQGSFRRLLPLMAHATGTLDLEEFDLVVSSSSAFAHGVRVRADALHVCYCYTPFRYAWYEQERALREVPSLARPLLQRQLRSARRWDRAVAQRVTQYVAISEYSRTRIRECLGRDALVVHPPVELTRFQPGTPEDYFLVVCELVQHKQVELAIKAAAAAGQCIKVVGAGPDEARLRSIAGPCVEFLGRVSDAELADIYTRCRALIVPNIEEFGIVSVEAQASGRPVLAIDAGGARETVVDGETGTLVEGSVDAVARAMREVDWEGFETERLVANARRFCRVTFGERLLAAVDGTVRRHGGSRVEVT